MSPTKKSSSSKSTTNKTNNDVEIIRCFFAIKEMVVSNVGQTLVENKTLSSDDVNNVLTVVEQSLEVAVDRLTGQVSALLKK